MKHDEFNDVLRSTPADVASTRGLYSSMYRVSLHQHHQRRLPVESIALHVLALAKLLVDAKVYQKGAVYPWFTHEFTTLPYVLEYAVYLTQFTLQFTLQTRY